MSHAHPQSRAGDASHVRDGWQHHLQAAFGAIDRQTPQPTPPDTHQWSA